MAKKGFYIPKIHEEKPEVETEETVSEKVEKKFKSEQFVSPLHGKKVKDVSTFPYVRYGNRGTQYEGLRENRIVSDEELERKHGTKYYEFTQIQGLKPQTLEEEEVDEDLETEFGKNTNPSYDNKQYEEFMEKRYEDQARQAQAVRPHFEETEYEELEHEKPQYNEPELEEPVQNSYQNDYQRELPRSMPPRPAEERVVENFDTSGIKTAFPKKKRKSKYIAPPISLLKRGERKLRDDYAGVNYQKEIIDRTLADFRIGGRVVHFTKGPTVTQFEVKLDAGVKVEKVKGIQRNLQMNLEGRSIRIEAPIPGKATVGIEVPNIVQDTVLIGDLLARDGFLKDNNPLNVVLGLDISGNVVDLDITSMPHALIAGTTGSGKSVCINTILTSIIYKATPDQVRLVLIDPKLIEFSAYEDVPHLATPVINDPKLATTALKWAVDEMQNRYELFKATKRRDIISYNEYAVTTADQKELPYIVIVIDELADLMFIAASSVEEYIQRLAQKARAAGIHLIMATQRPSTDVIKGTIKANMQTRIAFALNSQVDSMTILDKAGADKLLGKGDMLYYDGVNESRVQGAFITLEEILAVTDHVKGNYDPDFMFSKEELTKKMEHDERSQDDGSGDEYFELVARYVVENDVASINRVQREFGIGFNRAQNIFLAMENMGIVSEGIAGRPRTVLVSLDELDEILNY